MNIIKSILTGNDCYKAGKTITVRGLMLHSVGCPQPDATVFVRNWNREDLAVCVHAFIDGNTGKVYQTLPWNRRAWHCGDVGNNSYIGVEMCEPNTIRYTSGSTWVETSDGKNTAAVVDRTYKAAVELFAYLCKEFNLDPLEDGVILSHSEGAARGIASGHADVEHIWDKLGYSMDGFRKDVAAAAGLGNKYCIQLGAFKDDESADYMCVRADEAGFDAYIAKIDGMYKVRVDASNDKEHAEELLANIKAAGFDGAFFTERGDYSAVEEKKETAALHQKVNVTYQVRTKKHGWLGEILNLTDYAGWEDSPITGVTMRVDKGSIKYRVHTVSGKWLGWITKNDIKDAKKGYAGNGEAIDAIQIYYYTPDGIRPYKQAVYRVMAKGRRDYWDWQFDTDTTGHLDGYAGTTMGIPLTRLQVEIR